MDKEKENPDSNRQLGASTKICEIHKIERQKQTIKFGGMDYQMLYCPLCGEEEDRKEAESARLREEAKYLNGIAPAFQHAEPSDFDERTIRPVVEWADAPDGFLFVHGNCGCGKSHLMAGVKKYFNRHKVRSELVFSSDLFLRLRNSFKDRVWESEEDVIDYYTTSPNTKVCLFDDVGAQKISEYTLESWYSIIDRRYRALQPTMFTSNLNLQEISNYMGDRIASRLASGTVFEMKGEDRRVK